MNLIIDRVYIGTWQEAASLVNQNSVNITTVLNVAEPIYPRSNLIEYRNIIFADSAPIPREQFDACMNFLNDRYSENKDILVHCALGVSRSPVIVGAFLVKIKYCSDLAEALALIKAKREIVNPHPVVYQSAQQYLNQEVRRD